MPKYMFAINYIRHTPCLNKILDFEHPTKHGQSRRQRNMAEYASVECIDRYVDREVHVTMAKLSRIYIYIYI